MGYLVNPVESREASMEKPATLEHTMETPPDITEIEGSATWTTFAGGAACSLGLP